MCFRNWSPRPRVKHEAWVEKMVCRFSGRRYLGVCFLIFLVFRFAPGARKSFPLIVFFQRALILQTPVCIPPLVGPLWTSQPGRRPLHSDHRIGEATEKICAPIRLRAGRKWTRARTSLARYGDFRKRRCGRPFCGLIPSLLKPMWIAGPDSGVPEVAECASRARQAAMHAIRVPRVEVLNFEYVRSEGTGVCGVRSSVGASMTWSARSRPSRSRSRFPSLPVQHCKQGPGG